MEIDELILADDLQDITRVASLVDKIEMSMEEAPLCSALKAQAMSIALGRNRAGVVMRKKGVNVPSFGEVLAIEAHLVVILPQAYVVFIASVLPDKKASVIRRVVAEVVLNPSIDLFVRRLVARCAEADGVITLNPQETEAAHREAFDHFEDCLYERFKSATPDSETKETASWVTEWEAAVQQAIDIPSGSIQKFQSRSCIITNRMLLGYDVREFPVLARLMDTCKQPDLDSDQVSSMKAEILGRLLGRNYMSSLMSDSGIEALPLCESRRFENHEALIIPQLSALFITYVQNGKEEETIRLVVEGLLRDSSLGEATKAFIKWCLHSHKIDVFSVAETRKASHSVSSYCNRAMEFFKNCKSRFE